MAGTKKAAETRLRGKDGRYKGRAGAAKKQTAKSSGQAEPEPGAETPLRPAQCRRYLRRELAHSFRGIVRGFVKQAESGSAQHLKLTTELLEAPGGRRKGKGSAQVLLEKLERMEGEDAPEDCDEAAPAAGARPD